MSSFFTLLMIWMTKSLSEQKKVNGYGWVGTTSEAEEGRGRPGDGVWLNLVDDG
jgi:hypothetical protein